MGWGFIALLLFLAVDERAQAEDAEFYQTKVYEEKSGSIDYEEFDRSISPPANVDNVYKPHKLGAKGYRSSLIASGVNLRTPGLSLVMEYNFNRWAVGASASFRNVSRSLLKSGEVKQFSNSVYYGLYSAYYFLPFKASPYLLFGLALSSNAPQSVGPILGGGIEIRLFSGVFATASYTYQGIEEDKFPGIGVGWAY